MNREVPLEGAETAQRVPRKIALPGWGAREIDCRITSRRSGWRICERCRIKRFASWILRSVQVKRLSRHYVGTNDCHEVVGQRESENTVIDIDRWCGASLKNVL